MQACLEEIKAITLWATDDIRSERTQQQLIDGLRDLDTWLTETLPAHELDGKACEDLQVKVCCHYTLLFPHASLVLASEATADRCTG